MAKHLLTAATYLLFLLTAMKHTNSARILDEDSPASAPPALSSQPSVPASTPITGVTPAAPSSDTPDPSDPVSTPITAVAPVVPPVVPQQPIVTEATTTHHPLTFFMHDIVGGSNTSARVVTGIVADNSAVNGQLPFSRPNKDIFPINGALPIPNGVNGLINSNNVPSLVGLGGTTTTIGQTNGGNIANGGSNNLPFVTAGDLPTGATIQNLLFGTTTVIDDELTEGHDIGSTVIGKAQGFYVASSEDGTSQTIALTAMFEGGDHSDTISFFGVHRTAALESHVAIIGGTGKYENASGYAAIQTLHQVDQHTTDGVETLLQFSVYLSS